MDINTRADLISSLSQGINIKLEDNILKTQTKIEKFFNNIFDTFRDNDVIALRNQNLAKAISFRCNENNNNTQIQIINIGQEEQNNINQLKKDIILSMVPAALKSIYKKATENELHNMTTVLRNIIKIDINIDNLANIQVSHHRLKNVTLNLIPQYREILDNICLLNLGNVTRSQKINCQKYIKKEINNTINHYFNADRYFQETGISTQSLQDVNRERPIIRFNNQEFQIGQNIDNDNPALDIHELRRNQFKNIIPRLTQNISEQKIISMLCEQTALHPINDILAHVAGSPKLGHSETAYHNISILCGAMEGANMIRYQITMDQKKITLLHTVAIKTSFPNAEILGRDVGMLSYKITIPRNQFYEHGVVPQLQNIPQNELEVMHQEAQIGQQQQGIFNGNLKFTVHSMVVEPNEEQFLIPDNVFMNHNGHIPAPNEPQVNQPKVNEQQDIPQDAVHDIIQEQHVQ